MEKWKFKEKKKRIGLRVVWIAFALNLTLWLITARGLCAEGEVLFLYNSEGESGEKAEVEFACRFYGLEMRPVRIEDGRIKKPLLDSLRLGKRAVIVTEGLFSRLEEEDILTEIYQGRIKSNIIVLGVDEGIGDRKLRKWSRGRISGCSKLPNGDNDTIYQIGEDQRDVAQELVGQEFRGMNGPKQYFVPSGGSGVQIIMGLKRDGRLLPSFLRFSAGSIEIFFTTKSSFDRCQGSVRQQEHGDCFGEIAPLMMFLKYSLKEYCWHNTWDYANLTIDDPWLIEPYGFLSYGGLVKEMEKADFHTTIAFIPWNFDRSQNEVAELFRRYPARLSICIHGNNHDYREFYPMEKRGEDDWPEESLKKQGKDLAQAIARMERFRELTGLPYDRVMVFPRGSVTEMNLHLLKRYEFLATVNGNNMPSEARKGEDTKLFSRAVSMQFSNFPSISRWYLGNPLTSSDIARELFLDNPLLLYGHHDYFKNGIDGFNKTAILVKRIQPRIRWGNLGEIVQHLYLERMLKRGVYEVMPYSTNILLKNVHQEGIAYHVRKSENSNFPISKVLVNGKSQLFNMEEKGVFFEVFLLPGESAKVEIEHGKEFKKETAGIEKAELKVRLFRTVADFRDLSLSQNACGRLLIDLYYYNRNKFELGKWVSLILVCGAIFFAFWAVKYFKERDKEN